MSTNDRDDVPDIVTRWGGPMWTVRFRAKKHHPWKSTTIYAHSPTEALDEWEASAAAQRGGWRAEAVQLKPIDGLWPLTYEEYVTFFGGR